MAPEPAASTPEPSTEQIVEVVYRFAAELLGAGVAPDEVRRQLVAKGLDEETAAVVVARLAAARREEALRVGSRNMLHGALWAVGGLVVTIVTMAAAAGGGTYVVAWGAIVLGAVQFGRGWHQRWKALTPD
jgi:hypothetical protein